MRECNTFSKSSAVTRADSVLRLSAAVVSMLLLILAIASCGGDDPMEGNRPPVINGFSVPSEVESGGSVTVDCDADDPDVDFLLFNFSATAGTFTGTGQRSVRTFNAPVVTEDTVVTITVEVSDNRGGKVTETKDITVKAPAPPKVSSISPKTGESGSSVTFTYVNDGGTPTSWEWNFNGAGTPNTSSTESPTIVLGEPGTYEVTLLIANEHGDDFVFIEFTVTAASTVPKVSSVSPTSGDTGDSATIVAVVTGDTPLSYSWNFGGGAAPNTSTDEAPTVTLGDPGEYSGSVTVENSSGEDTFNFTLTVNEKGEIGWQTETVDSEGDVGWGASLALDSLGGAHISYIDFTNNQAKYAHQISVSPGWNLVPIVSEGDPGLSTSIAVDSQDHVHMSYFDWTNNFLVYSYFDGTWQTEIVESGGGLGWDTSIAVDSADSPHITFYNGEFKYAVKVIDGWNLITLDGEGIVGDLSSIAIDSQDRPHISYYDYINFDLTYALFDGGLWNFETVDSEGDVGQHPSLVLDSDDNPHISYLDSTNNGLKYAAQIAVPAGWNLVPVVDLGEVGGESSLALDSDGNPHVSYFDNLLQDLKYAYYDGTSWQFTTVDSAGNMGGSTSLALDSAGNPHIGYWVGDPDWDLKYATLVP